MIRFTAMAAFFRGMCVASVLLAVAASSTARGQEAYQVPDELRRRPELPEGMDARGARTLALSEAIQIAVQQNLGVVLVARAGHVDRRERRVCAGESRSSRASTLWRYRDRERAAADLPPAERRLGRAAQDHQRQLERRRQPAPRDRHAAVGRLHQHAHAHQPRRHAAQSCTTRTSAFQLVQPLLQGLRLRSRRTARRHPARALRLRPRARTTCGSP